MKYKIEHTCSPESEIQKYLNNLYNYSENISLQVQHRGRLNLFYSLMSELITNKKIKSFDNALDIGCNAGFYSKMILDFGFSKVQGIDITQSSLDSATANYKALVEQGILSFRLENAETYTSSIKYNFILCTEVIEHTNNPGKVVNNIMDLLATEGIAVITLPNKISWPYFVEYLAYKLKNKPYNQDLIDHLNYPFYKSMRMFNAKGIKIIKTSGYNAFLDSLTIRFMAEKKCLRFFNKLNFKVSKFFPFKYFSQFFFIVIHKK